MKYYLRSIHATLWNEVLQELLSCERKKDWALKAWVNFKHPSFDHGISMIRCWKNTAFKK